MELNTIIEWAGTLCGVKKSETFSDLKDVLTARLKAYYASRGLNEPANYDVSLQSIQQTTASEALTLLEEAHNAYNTEQQQAPSASAASSAPSSITVGARDLGRIRVLLALTFRWGIELHLTNVIASWPSKPTASPVDRRQIVDLTTAPDDHRLVTAMTTRVLNLIYPQGLRGSLSSTIVTVALLERHVMDLLRPCLALGWLPKSLSTMDMPTVDEFRSPVMRLLAT
jgi:hypothetical protein